MSQQSTLSTADLAILRAPFALDDHEFLRGFVYLTEGAITTRIETVDPAWTLTIHNVYVRGSEAICHVTLTIKGVSRDGIGQHQITEKGAEAEKSAATDALKRAARLFGVGRYLLDFEGDKAAFAKWLKGERASSWTRDEMAKWWKLRMSEGLSQSDIFAALNVKGLGEWQGTMQQATEAVEQFIARQLSTNGASS
jgi:hypothetical protein